MMMSFIHPNCGSLSFTQVIMMQSFFKVVPLYLAHLALKISMFVYVIVQCIYNTLPKET